MEMMNRQMPETKPLGNSPKPSPPIPALCPSLRVHCHPLSGALTRLIGTTSQVQLHQSGMQPECKSSFGLDAPARTHGVGHKPTPGSFFAPQVLSKMHHLHHYRPFRKKKLEMFCAWCERHVNKPPFHINSTSKYYQIMLLTLPAGRGFHLEIISSNWEASKVPFPRQRASWPLCSWIPSSLNTQALSNSLLFGQVQTTCSWTWSHLLPSKMNSLILFPLWQPHDLFLTTLQ